MSFRLGSIPVRVHAQFLMLAVFLVMNERDPRRIGIWVAVIFVSVLLHELGHAVVGKAFGLTPQIDLHGMGGTTSWAEPRDVGHARRIAISLAGPFAGFAAALVAYLLSATTVNPWARAAIAAFWWVNTRWGIFNLLPLLPLDGGNVLRSALAAATKGGGEKATRIVSVIVCGGLVVYAYRDESWMLGILAVLFGYSNVRALKDAGTRRADAALATAIEEAHRALEKQDGNTAVALVRPLLVPEASPELRAMATQLVAYSLLIEAKWDDLLPLLEKEHALIGPEDLKRFAHTARELGRTADADRIAAIGAKSEGAPGVSP